MERLVALAVNTKIPAPITTNTMKQESKSEAEEGLKQPDAKPVLADGLVVGEIIVADIIGKGFYEIHSFGETFVNVKLLKLFGQGWRLRGHITNCNNYPHPINLERWLRYKRVSKHCT